MNGNFNDKNTGIKVIASILLLIAGFIIILAAAYSLDEITGQIIIIPLSLCLGFLLLGADYLLGLGRYTADEKSVRFRLFLIKKEYFYQNIRSASVTTVFESTRYGKIPYVQITIKLKSGESVSFTDRMSEFGEETIDGLKKAQDNHEFTELCSYINDRLK